MEIAPNIHRIACTFGERVVYTYFLQGEERSLLVDTGMAFSPEQDIFPYLHSIGVDPASLDLIFITHSDVDHQGGNDILRQAAPQAIFASHILDAPWIESAQALISGRYSQFEKNHAIGYGEQGKTAIAADCRSETKMDWHLQGGERFRMGPGHYVQFIHTPGHTWGHTVVFDKKSKTMIAGEASLHKAILGQNGQPALPPTYCYIPTYEATLQRLLQMEIATYAPAHWPVQRGPDIKTFLSESLSYLHETEQKVLDLLEESAEPLTLKQIIHILNDALGTWPAASSQDLAYPLAGHLQRLLERGLIQQLQSQGLSAYQGLRGNS